MLAKSLLRVKGLSEEVTHNRLFNWLLLTEREVCMGESWLRSPLQTERSEGCTSDWGQDSPIQTNLALLIRCLLYGQTRKQRNKNINFASCLLIASWAWLKLILATFAYFLYLLPREGPLILPFGIINRNKPIFSYSLFVTFWGQLLQQDQSRWENLGRSQDWFQPINSWISLFPVLLRHGHVIKTK